MIYSVRCSRPVVDSHFKRGHRFRYEDLSGTERDPSARLSPTHLPLNLLFAGPIQSAESWLKEGGARVKNAFYESQID